MKKVTLFSIIALLFSINLVLAQDQTMVEWPLENTDFINNNNTHTVLGVPEVVDGLVGNGMLFNGITDGLLIDDNPIANAEGYTVEFYAYPQETETKAKLINVWTAEEDTGMFVECWGTTPDKEPLEGFVHFKIHQTDGFWWWGKAFTSALPVDNWYHIAMVVTADTAKVFVNHELDGIKVYKDDEGYVEGREYHPFSGGFTSLGVRGGSNQKDFYTGVLDQVRFTKEALNPGQFMPVPEEVVSYKIYEMNNAEFIEGASGFITPLGVPEVVDGLVGNGVLFNGITDGFLVEENPVANAEGYTVEFYAYPHDTETKAKLINVWTAEEDTGMFVECWGTTPDKEPLAGNVHFKSHQTDGFWWWGKAFTSALPVDNWYHIAMVVTADTGKIFVNHELDGIKVYKDDEGYVEGREYHPFSGGFTALGVRGGSNQKDFYTGVLDEVKFTKKALTPAELMPTPEEILTSVHRMTDRETIPRSMELLQNYPNPFNPCTNIQYSLSEPSTVSLKIYNMLGREIRDLVSENQQIGHYTALWDGTDNLGNTVGSGVYFCVLNTGNYTNTIKLVLMK